MPQLSFVRLNEQAADIELVFITTSQALARRGWELEPFETDLLGYPNELQGTDYNVVLSLEGHVDKVRAGWLPEQLYEQGTDLEPLEVKTLRVTANSLARAGQIWLKQDDCLDAAGVAVSGLEQSCWRN